VKRVKKIIKFLGLLISVAVTVGMVWHRFANPDMTEIRWIIEFWHVWLAWFVLFLLGCVLYLYGSGEK